MYDTKRNYERFIKNPETGCYEWVKVYYVFEFDCLDDLRKFQQLSIQEKIDQLNDFTKGFHRPISHD
jgi:hypothetical protein